MTAKDTSRYASALQQITTSGAQAIEEGLLTRKTVVTLLAIFARQLGAEFDVEQELKDAQAELAKQKAEDGYTEPKDTFDEDDEDQEGSQGGQLPPAPGESVAQA